MRMLALSTGMIGAMCCGLTASAQTKDVLQENAELATWLFAASQQPPAPKPGSVDEAIAAALKNHPDVKLAEAKRMVADAELEQAKLLVTQRITNAYTKVEQAKARVALCEKQFGLHKARVDSGVSSAEEGLGKSEMDLSAAKSELATAEADLNAAKGSSGKVAMRLATVTNNLALSADLALNQGTFLRSPLTLNYAGQSDISPYVNVAKPGTASEKLRALVNKKYTLKLAKLELQDGFAALLKEAGESDLVVRFPDAAKKGMFKSPPMVGPHTGELSFPAWVQMMMDDFNQNQSGMLDDMKGRYDVYVRDYGLLIARADSAPKDAMTLAEYVRQVKAAENAPKVERVTPKAEPKKDTPVLPKPKP